MSYAFFPPEALDLFLFEASVDHAFTRQIPYPGMKGDFTVVLFSFSVFLLFDSMFISRYVFILYELGFLVSGF